MHPNTTYTSANTDNGRQCALIESHGSLMFEDLTGAMPGIFVIGRRLQSYFDDICTQTRLVSGWMSFDITKINKSIWEYLPNGWPV